jgi:hypothetical protein
VVKFYREAAGTNSRDYSGIGILASNVLVILFAVREGWNLQAMMAIYWAQSVIIGIFHIFRMLLLRSFCTEGFTSNGKRVAESAAGKRSTAFFFAIHYGFFHLIYGIFLIGFAASAIDPGEVGTNLGPAPGDTDSARWFLFSIVSFVVGHAFSFYQNVRADLERRPNLGIMMFLPYARILPMHLTIILGAMAGSAMHTLLLFTGLKTGADYLMHIVEHRVLQKKPTEPKAHGTSP